MRREELPGRSAAGEVVVLDVRPFEEYAAGHIPLLHARGRRAVRLTDGMLEWRPAELPVGTENAA